MAAPPGTENAPGADRGASINIGPHGKQVLPQDSQAGGDGQAASLGEGLRDWARKRADRLAAEYVHGGMVNSAEAFFDGACEHERLLSILRDIVEPAFNARLSDLGVRS